jgi:hypothetical protein
LESPALAVSASNIPIVEAAPTTKDRLEGEDRCDSFSRHNLHI